ncbi:fibronectin type III domain-containing protein [Streptomyces sp. AP-93]|uniref:fibronectin type III domain-containing protein n=1 Tax=Streptomyces sp. AP-93 TaxID=2929048 RepID=UPI001FB01BC9|nr:PA14 domain-containing protein [Streptomyces sp. AP-93]MCJ0868691.1 PA14 domain-containing protein [Streptomyces sp. AP-93]
MTCKSPVFTRQFYANTTFSGTPKKTDCDSKIDQSWGTGTPATGLPSDNFAVRWTVTRDFGSGGAFSIPVETRDGLRVYLDGARKVDIWKNVSTTQKQTVNVTIPSGTHTLRFDFVNWTGMANVKADYLPRTSATVDKVKPLVPTGTSLSYSTSTYQAKFGWTANKEMDLAGYRVYRRLQGGTYGSTPLATTTATSYTDTTLPENGAVYAYEVRAYDKAGNESAGTADKYVTTVDASAPAAPKGVENAWKPGYSEKVGLSWYGNTEADLAGYRVYRSTTGRPVALTAANRVSGDQPLGGGWFEQPLPQTGDTYFYVVTAVDTHGNESAASGTAEFYTRDTTGPVDTAYHAKAVEDERGVTLTWDKSAVTSADFAGYTVLRYDRPRTQPGRTVAVVGKNIRGTSFTDTAPPPGATYYYSVVAVDGAGNGGPPSDEMAVTVAGNSTPPPPVTGTTATAKENGVSLSWDASGDPGLDHYRILRGTLVDGQWVYAPLQDAWTLRPWEFTQTHHLDRTVADGEQVRYGVVAVDQYGNQLTPETGASLQDVTELDLRPDSGAAPAVGDNTLGNLHGDVYGSVRWWGGDTGANGSKVTGYTVYRWNRSTRVFDKVDVQPRGNDTSWSYVDTTLPKGTTTYYRVTATLADGTETAARETAIASLD